jgi:hypothetical protein
MFYKLEALKVLPSTYRAIRKHILTLFKFLNENEFPFSLVYFPVAYFIFILLLLLLLLLLLYSSAHPRAMLQFLFISNSQTLKLYLLTFAFIFDSLSLSLSQTKKWKFLWKGCPRNVFPTRKIYSHFIFHLTQKFTNRINE